MLTLARLRRSLWPSFLQLPLRILRILLLVVVLLLMLASAAVGWLLLTEKGLQNERPVDRTRHGRSGKNRRLARNNARADQDRSITPQDRRFCARSRTSRVGMEPRETLAATAPSRAREPWRTAHREQRRDTSNTAADPINASFGA